MDQENARKLKDKMLEFLYRDNDGVLLRNADMVEIGLELKCDEETSQLLARALHSDGLIQLIDPWSFDAYLTEQGLKHLQTLFIGTSRSMKSFEPRSPGLKQLRNTRAPERPRKSIPGKVILVVDDDVMVIELMRNILQDMGYVMDSATDGESGLKKATLIHPSLIFLDVCLPEMGGTSVYELLRKEESLTDVPVVFLTGTCPEEVSQQVTACADTYYLQKPVSIDLFRETISKVFQA
jgi:CheY-like chemotaxis protein